MGELLEAVKTKNLILVRELSQNPDIIKEEARTGFPALEAAVENDNPAAFTIARAIIGLEIAITPELQARVQIMYKSHIPLSINNHTDAEPAPALEDVRQPARTNFLHAFDDFRKPYAEAANDQPSFIQRMFRRFICQ